MNRKVFIFIIIILINIIMSIDGESKCKCNFIPGDMIRSNYIGEMILCYIPPGEFEMELNGIDIYNDSPFHEFSRIRISNGFFICKTEITQYQWKKVMGSNPSKTKGNNLPVENVLFGECLLFCNKLSELDGLKPCYYTDKEYNNAMKELPSNKKDEEIVIYCNFQANGYRLPTEAEWEYACRAGTKTDTYLGDIQSTEYDPILERIGWFDFNNESRTHSVGMKEANAWGLYDMLGNVSEWCWDFNKEYPKSGILIDPHTSEIHGNQQIITRGGSPECGFRNFSFTNWNNQRYFLSGVGFRVVRKAENNFDH